MDPGSGFMRSGPPARSQMKPNTNSVSRSRPEKPLTSAATQDTAVTQKVSGFLKGLIS